MRTNILNFYKFFCCSELFFCDFCLSMYQHHYYYYCDYLLANCYKHFSKMFYSSSDFDLHLELI